MAAIGHTAKHVIRYGFYGLVGLYCLGVIGINVALLFAIGPLAYLGLGLVVIAIVGFWMFLFKILDWAFS